MADEIIEEIRKIRSDLDKLIKKDPAKFKKEIEEIEKKYKDRLVSGKPRYIKKSAA
jgi:ElaB/YqjD/DUF883 family membrane-anchored ribosome-binding protein